MKQVRLLACVSLLAGAFVALSGQAAQAATVRYEAESGSCTGTIDSNHAGYSGSGFCNGTNAVGAGVQWTAAAPASGASSIAVRYANGTTDARTAQIIVDGATISTQSFGGTGAWTTWTTITVNLNLNAGNHTVRLNPTTANGLANIDFVDVTTQGTGPQPQPPGGLSGWATQGGGTTGGGSASPTTVTSASALTSALSGSGAAVIRVSGTISCSGMLRVASNKTILGNSERRISGCGFNISEASNVIVRNLTFRGWNDDAINVQYSTRVWIDHNTFGNGYDGAVDIKRASDYVTVSWNRVFSHDKSMLLGHDDGNGGEDRGHLRVTYHHNWFDGTNQRHPRVRFGNPVHVLQQLLQQHRQLRRRVHHGGAASSSRATTSRTPTTRTTSVRATHRPGQPGGAQQHVRQLRQPARPAAASAAAIPYSYTVESSGNVKASVTAGAGAGRISV